MYPEPPNALARWKPDEANDDLAAAIWRSVVRDTLAPPRHFTSWLLSKPAKQVGGDFHLTTDSWIAVGDVSGKGVPAALLTGMFVAALKLALRLPDPIKALEHALYDELERAQAFTTLAAVELGADGWLNYFNLGHPPALVRRSTGQVESLGAGAPPVGTFKLDTYPVQTVRLRPGDLLCLYTDGLIEAERNSGSGSEWFGGDRLAACLARHAQLADAAQGLLSELEPWQLPDDLTVLMLQYQPERGWTDERLSRR